MLFPQTLASARNTAQALIEKEEVSAEIPNTSGMMVIKASTPEASAREEEEGVVVTSIEVGGQIFLICTH